MAFKGIKVKTFCFLLDAQKHIIEVSHAKTFNYPSINMDGIKYIFIP